MGGNIARAALTGGAFGLVQAYTIGGGDLANFRADLADAAGKLWNVPNTAVGLAWGGLGMLGGADVSLGNNAIQFTNHPFTSGGVTLGNTISYGGYGFGPDVLMENGFTAGMHEFQHTIQGQLLGPLYLPSNIVGGVTALAVDHSWWGPINWNEVGPLSSPPRPW